MRTGPWEVVLREHQVIAPARAVVGREQELRLLSGLARSGRGGGAAAAVYGEAGIGKTTLLRSVPTVAEQETGTRCSVDTDRRPSRPSLCDPRQPDAPAPLRVAHLPAVQREALESASRCAPGRRRSARVYAAALSAS